MAQQLQKINNKQVSQRQAIRLKLKGTLNCCKQNKSLSINQQLKIYDRTPQPGTINSTFCQMYQNKGKIGEGASGIVYKCISKKDGKIFAVKVSRGDVELLRIAKRTFKIMKRLNHPYIIKTYSLFLNEVSEKIHFIMEYCPFPSLSSIEKQLSYQEKKEIVQQLVEALNYLHKTGVCHRDIKFENVLYNRQERQIKIIDFGICKQIFDKNRQHAQMWTTTGTLQYMAPQILTGSTYDEKVDIWALGVLVYQLFYGKLPFDSNYKSQVIQKICSSQPEYENDKEMALNDFIKHLLTKNAQNRMSAAQCLKYPWILSNETRKDRFGSFDEYDAILFDLKMRNYSQGYNDSPLITVSREDRISQFKERSIFQQKKQYSSYSAVCT